MVTLWGGGWWTLAESPGSERALDGYGVAATREGRSVGTCSGEAQQRLLQSAVELPPGPPPTGPERAFALA